MKRTYAFLAALVLTLTLMAGCSSTSDAQKGASGSASASATEAPLDVAMVIGEKMFATSINELYNNFADYDGKAIAISGYVARYDGDPFVQFAVLRDYFCCGNDAYPYGLDCNWTGNAPANEDWVTVTGTLSDYEQDGSTYIKLDVIKVEPLSESERGERIVYD